MTKLLRFLSVWPLWLLHVLGWLLGWLVFALSATYRRRFVDNATQAGVKPRHWLRAVGQAGMMVAELPRLWFGRPVYAEWRDSGLVEAALARGRGMVFLTPHLGCFEITAQAYARCFGAKQPMTVMFRPARQAWLDELMGTVRARAGLTAVPTRMSGVKQMLKALRQGESVGLLPDQVPPEGLGVWVPFWGRDAYTMTLSVRLIQQTGATVMLVWGRRLNWGRGYVVHVSALEESLPDDVQQAATRINRAMEQLIAQCPQQYLWGYARYKQPRQESI